MRSHLEKELPSFPHPQPLQSASRRWVLGAALVCLAILATGCGSVCLCGTTDPKTGKVCCQDVFQDYQYAPPVRLCSGLVPRDANGVTLPGWIVTNKFTDSSCGSGMLNQVEWTDYANKPASYPHLETVAICSDDLRTGPPQTQKYVATGFRQQSPSKCPSTSGAWSVIRLTRYDGYPAGSEITVCDAAGIWSSPPAGFVAVGPKFRSSDCDSGVPAALNAQLYRR